MAVKIRLQRHGAKKRPFYHIVIADSRSPRDGKFIEKIGVYNPLTSPATIELDNDKAYEWLNNGAQPTDTVHAILKYKGVLYQKHLQRGVSKGAFTQEKATEMLAAFLAKKEKTIEVKKQEVKASLEDRRRRIFGEAPAKPAAKPAPEASENTEA